MYSIFFILIISLYDAKGQGKYYPKQQWYASSHPHFPVKAKPENVTEYFYNGVDSLFKTDVKKFGSYDEFTYDTAGNLLSRKLFFDDDLWSSFTSSFTATGSVTEFQFKSKTGTKKGIFKKVEPIANGRYKETVYNEKVISRITYYTYKNNGNEVTTEETQKTGNYSTKTTNKFVYNGNQLLRRSAKVISGKEISAAEKFYYYDKDNFLDSIITNTGKYRNRLVFIKNEHSDPVTEIEIEHNDTTQYNTYIYLYDAKGNWISRVKENHVEDKWIQREKFSLIRRDIIY